MTRGKYFARVGFCLAVLAAAASTHAAEPVSGRLVTIGDRQIDIRCVGEGPRTAVVITGGASPATTWRRVQDSAATFTRICLYDRPGYGASTPLAAPMTFEDRAQELHKVLAIAGERGPFVLVAHSWGGFLARSFVRRYPKEIAGVVLVDAVEEGLVYDPAVVAILRQQQAGLSAAAAAARKTGSNASNAQAQVFETGALEAESYWMSSKAQQAPGGYGRLKNIPLVVMRHGRPFPQSLAPLETGWPDAQGRLAALSSRSQTIVAEKSDHMINLTEPELIVDAIRQLAAHP